jgi:ABC-2 type transport system ATP-binding protein
MNANAIEIRGLTKHFPTFTLGPLDLTVPCGAIYGFIGPNGAGKSTTIDLMFGMGRNDGGEIRVLGYDHRASEVDVKRRAAYVSPDLNFQVWGRVGRVIRFVRGFYTNWDNDYCERLMKAFHLSGDDKITTLSFGARTKLSLLLALARRPQVLVLDEPTTGLDAVSKQEVFGELLKAVEDGERTVLISSHGLSDIERFADHVGMIKDGKLLLEGRMDEVVDRFRMAEFFTDNGVELPNHEGLIVVRREQNRWHVLLDQKHGLVDWLQGQGAKQISLTRVTLEDMFVALVKDDEAI